MPDPTPAPSPSPAPQPAPVLENPAPSPAPSPAPILSGEPASNPAPSPAPAQAAWPEDWRDKLAGGDAKVRERLDRFTDPALIVKSWLEADKKISAGVYKKTLSENPTAEELASYRKEIGLPEKAEEYPLEAPKDVTITEPDKAILGEFKKLAHEHAIDPKIAKLATDWFLAKREIEMQDFYEAADKKLQDRIVELRTEWGGEYNKNVTLGNNFIAEVMGDKGPQLANVLLADGTKLGSNPDFVRFIAQAARQYGGVDALSLGDGGDAGQNIESRMNDLKKLMGDQRSDYWRGPKSAELQAEYRNLLQRKERTKSRAA